MLGTVLIVILILALLGALPRWTHSRQWGYVPTGGVGTVLLIVVSITANSSARHCAYLPRYFLLPTANLGPWMQLWSAPYVAMELRPNMDPGQGMK
jgi:hypothetical protein